MLHMAEGQLHGEILTRNGNTKKTNAIRMRRIVLYRNGIELSDLYYPIIFAPQVKVAAETKL